MSSPIFAITLHRWSDHTLRLYIRRTRTPKKKANHLWDVGVGVEHIKTTIATYGDYFPRAHTKEWVVSVFTNKKAPGTLLQLRRVIHQDHARMSFDDAYELFESHMEFFCT